MKKLFISLFSLCLLLSACENNTTSPNADNQASNVRDSEQTITPENQSLSEVDRIITQRIREALMNDDSLSTNAKNVKIATLNGVVTLRGPVNSDGEKNIVGRKAQEIANVRNVDNQLEIIRNGNRTL